MKNLSSCKRIAVHDGVFHADDVLCVALTSICNPKVEVIRTRSNELLATCDLVADVGRGKYDHHQKDVLRHPEGFLYSGCGLLWEDFGEEVIRTVVREAIGSSHLPNKAVAEVKELVKLKIFNSVDLADNGVDIYVPESKQEGIVGFDNPSTALPPSRSTISSIISSFNISGIPNAPLDVKASFELAVDLAEVLVKSCILSYIQYDGKSLLEESPDYDSSVHMYISLVLKVDPPYLNNLKDNSANKELEFTDRLLNRVVKRYPKLKNMIDEMYLDSVELVDTARQLVNFLINPLTDSFKVEYILPEYQSVLELFSLKDVLCYLGEEAFTEFLDDILCFKLISIAYRVQCKKVVNQIVDKAMLEGRRYIIIPNAMPWQTSLLDVDPAHSILFCIFERHDGTYGCQAVPQVKGKMECVAYHPTEWRAKSQEELSDLTGFNDFIFCHSSGFFLVTGTLETAISLTQSSINKYEKSFK